MAVLQADDEEFTMDTRDASPAHLLMKIKSFSLLSKCGIGKYKSREFESGGYKWSLIICPDGRKSENEGDHISVYLTMADINSRPVDWEVNAVFTIFLFNQISDNYLCFRGKMRRFHAMKYKWGFSKLMAEKSLMEPCNGFLVDDTFVFGAEVFVIKGQRVIDYVSVLEDTDPYKRDWKISEFSELGEDWTSEIFFAGGQEWRTELCPNGDGIEEGRCVSIFLELVGAESLSPHEKVKADYCMRIKNQLHDDYCSRSDSQWFSSSSSFCGFAPFIPIADMHNPAKGFLVNDCCFVELELSVRAVVR